MTFAIVPAAGLSSRMGRPKLLLDLGGRTVIEHVVFALRAGGVDRVLVVVGPHVAELEPLARSAGADVLALPEPTPDMRTTVELGFDWVEQHMRPGPEESWLLVPADHPVMNPDVVRRVLAADGEIVVPACDGRRGHPARFRWRHVAGIRSLPVDRGINAFVREHATEVREIAAGPDVLLDLDTPEDLARLKDHFHYPLTNVPT
jgi:CTP:molybdopterin cytidylyltransferase MocA